MSDKQKLKKAQLEIKQLSSELKSQQFTTLWAWKYSLALKEKL